ncbi:Uncharacterized protein HZ326_27839 [Fusarium oxysporum f. sp. albedinis]|nr:Uncharacterized protein HZ326_27839 [Fusarium oxysporum f. sp. albedinis]
MIFTVACHFMRSDHSSKQGMPDMSVPESLTSYDPASTVGPLCVSTDQHPAKYDTNRQSSLLMGLSAQGLYVYQSGESLVVIKGFRCHIKFAHPLYRFRSRIRG